MQRTQNKTPFPLRERAGVRVKVKYPNPAKSPLILIFSPEGRGEKGQFVDKSVNPVSAAPKLFWKIT